MGWSSTKAAGDVIDRWSNKCLQQTNQQNVYILDGRRYFFEVIRKEHADGAITGEIWKYVNETHANQVGTFRIEGDGVVSRGPQILKDLDEAVREIDLTPEAIGFDLKQLANKTKILPHQGRLHVVYLDREGKRATMLGRWDEVIQQLCQVGYKLK
jgi:hypothetical protein